MPTGALIQKADHSLPSNTRRRLDGLLLAALHENYNNLISGFMQVVAHESVCKAILTPIAIEKVLWPPIFLGDLGPEPRNAA
jgi:hypothetical protein